MGVKNKGNWNALKPLVFATLQTLNRVQLLSMLMKNGALMTYIYLISYYPLKPMWLSMKNAIHAKRQEKHCKVKKQASETDIDMAEMLDYQPENVIINNVIKSPMEGNENEMEVAKVTNEKNR